MVVCSDDTETMPPYPPDPANDIDDGVLHPLSLSVL
jgi:hypothetical protein